MTNNKIIHLVSRFNAIFRGDNWLDETFQKKLDALDARTAFKQPLEGVHSIAEILWHCTYWRQTLIHRMTGDPGFRDRTVDEQNFLPLETLVVKGWTNLLNEFNESQEQLVSFLAARTDEFLEEKYTQDQSYEYLIEGMLDHDAYHLGQIGLVHKILRVQKGSE